MTHISTKGLEELSKQGLLPKGLFEQVKIYEHCIMGKAKRNSFTKAYHTTKEIMDYVNSNL